MTAKVIDVYPYSLQENKIKFLLFKRNKAKIYAGQWRMVGGKILATETAWQAGLRELFEETGLKPQLYWSIPSLNHFYEPKSDQILWIPAFAAQISENESILLNEEHESFKWFDLEEIPNLHLWPEQERLIQLLAHLVLEQTIKNEWIIEVK